MTYAAVQTSYQSTYRQLPFTAVPNIYYDRIKQTLTDTQRVICDVVIRYTYGYHRVSAAISNATFAKKGNKTIQGIIKAKKQLIEMGLLVELQKGGGRNANIYTLDLYYNDPKLSMRAPKHVEANPTTESTHTRGVVLKLEARVLEPTTESDGTTTQSGVSIDAPNDITGQSNAVDGGQTASTQEPAALDNEQQVSNEPVNAVEPNMHSQENNTVSELSDSKPAAVNAQNNPCSIWTFNDEPNDEPEETTVPAPTTYTSRWQFNNEPEDEPTPEPEQAENPVAIEADGQATTKLSLVPSDPGPGIIYINKQTVDTTSNENANDTKSTTATKPAIASVRSEFSKLFPEHVSKNTIGDDYKFFGWSIKTYGIDVCMEKLRILKEYRKLRPIGNPRAMFRTALAENYQPSKRVRAKLLADEKARRAVDKSRKESEEWKRMVENYDHAARDTAIQNIINMLDEKEEASVRESHSRWSIN